jgi:drug/metabolite transporter (DMT)-like permease
MLCGATVVIISAIIQNGLLPNAIGWPDWPYSTLLGIVCSGLGFGVGYWISRRQSAPQDVSESLALPDLG